MFTFVKCSTLIILLILLIIFLNASIEFLTELDENYQIRGFFIIMILISLIASLIIGEFGFKVIFYELKLFLFFRNYFRNQANSHFSQNLNIHHMFSEHSSFSFVHLLDRNFIVLAN